MKLTHAIGIGGALLLATGGVAHANQAAQMAASGSAAPEASAPTASASDAAPHKAAVKARKPSKHRRLKTDSRKNPDPTSPHPAMAPAGATPPK